MIDVAGGISLGKDFFQFITWIKGIVGADIISAYFKYDGTLIHGSENIKVELNTTDKPEVFWFNVTAVRDYVFVRFPINSSGCEELIGIVQGEQLPDPMFWRWVMKAQSGTIVGSNYIPANAKVDFVVVGYKPAAIIKYLSSAQ